MSDAVWRDALAQARADLAAAEKRHAEHQEAVVAAHAEAMRYWRLIVSLSAMLGEPCEVKSFPPPVMPKVRKKGQTRRRQPQEEK